MFLFLLQVRKCSDDPRFFDHSGILKNLIKLCLDLDYTVVCFDLPGHGLSSGRASIDNSLSMEEH